LQAFTARCCWDPLLVALAAAIVVAADSLQALLLPVPFKEVFVNNCQLVCHHVRLSPFSSYTVTVQTAPSLDGKISVTFTGVQSALAKMFN
jgi:hypothetical protein